MKLSNVPLLESLLEIECGGVIIDFHNDYTCLSFKLDKNNFTLNFYNDKSYQKIDIIFIDCIIKRLDFNFTNIKGFILDNFHRGRFEVDNKLYDTYSNKECYYLEFLENGNVELLCKHIIIDKGVPPQKPTD